jgi:rhodanese-related sulfurtransferase
MDQKTFSIVAGVIFAAVALFHLVRIYMDWPVMIGGWSVPMWVSWIGLVVAGGLGRRRPSFSICALGGRSALAGKTLQELGYKSVYNAGALKDLAEAGLETEPA